MFSGKLKNCTEVGRYFAGYKILKRRKGILRMGAPKKRIKNDVYIFQSLQVQTETHHFIIQNVENFSTLCIRRFFRQHASENNLNIIFDIFRKYLLSPSAGIPSISLPHLPRLSAPYLHPTRQSGLSRYLTYLFLYIRNTICQKHIVSINN